MHTTSSWCLAVMALALSTPTLAKTQDQECGNVDAFVRHAYPGAVAQGERSVRVGSRTLTLPSPSSIDPHAIVCRRWRGQPGLVLVAVPLIAQVGVDSTSGDLEVLVVDEATGRTRQRLRIAHAMDDDAVRISGISFDTAAYRLGPDRLAFGVRRESFGLHIRAAIFGLVRGRSPFRGCRPRERPNVPRSRARRDGRSHGVARDVCRVECRASARGSERSGSQRHSNPDLRRRV